MNAGADYSRNVSERMNRSCINSTFGVFSFYWIYAIQWSGIKKCKIDDDVSKIECIVFIFTDYVFVLLFILILVLPMTKSELWILIIFDWVACIEDLVISFIMFFTFYRIKN